MNKHIFLFLVRLLLLENITGSTPLRPFGKAIVLPFPNEWDILGVGGLSYDQDKEIWTCTSENIPGTDAANKYPATALPRLHTMKFDFTKGEVEIISTVVIEPQEGLKLEDISLAPPGFSNEPEFWLVSEANSHLVTTNKYFSKDFGTPDLSTFDPETYSTSRIIRVDRNGSILENVDVPDFAQWDLQYDWDALQCIGDRPFQGFHAIAIVPASQNSDSDYTMIVGSQAALYQDGATPTDFDGSATRILFFKIRSNGTGYDVTYDKSYRYDSSQLTLDSYQKGARQFNAIFSMVAFNETALLIAECEELTGFGATGQTVTNRIFYVQIDADETVDHCHSLMDCNITAPSKRLVWERKDEIVELDGIAWGPMLTMESGETVPSIAIVKENDEKIGMHVELLVLDEHEIKNSPMWAKDDSKEEILKSRVVAVWVSIAIVVTLAILQAVVVRRILRLKRPQPIHISGATPNAMASKTSDIAEKLDASPHTNYKYICLGLSALNSFLVGGVTFGYSGMSLILREQGTFAYQCACGSFCSAEKEALALVSTVGFAVAIGSRLFVGLILDIRGPKITSIFCSVICFSGFVILGTSSSEALQSTFIWAWVLLSLGGSGLHVVGFHMTNNFKADGKKVASAVISTAFGASSAVFPIWQILNQNAGVSLQRMALAYSVIVFLILVANFFIQPWKKVQPGNPLSPDWAVLKSSWWNRGSKKSKPIVVSSILELIRNFEFWGECIFYSFNLWLLTYYLSTSGAFLYEKGDIPFTSDPNDPTDYMFSRMAGWMNSLGFLWYPITKLLMLKGTWPLKFSVVISANVFVAMIVIAVQALEPQVITMVLLSCSRLMLFSFHHAFLLEKFGIEYFGILNGLSSFIAALIGLMNYPLQLWAVQSGNYSITFIPVGVAVLSTGFFAFFLSRRRILSWAGNYGVEPQKIRKPKDVNDIIDLVKNHEEVRCAGSMASCSPLVKSDGIVIDFQYMNNILDIDLDSSIATVQPGVKIDELCEAVKPHGLAVDALGAIGLQSLVGAVMTGTHGFSLSTPSLHDFVESYSLVMKDGEIKTITRDGEPELFSAMAPCIGVFGVVVECKIRLVKLQYLKAQMDFVPLEEIIPNLEEIMESNKHARIAVYPSLDMATVWRANPIEKNEEDAAGGQKTSKPVNSRDSHEKAWLELFLANRKRGNHEKANDFLRQAVESQLRRLNCYEGAYNHVLCNEQSHAIPYVDIEFGMEYSRADEVLTSVREWYMTAGNRVPFYNFEIRSTKSDNALMSSCYDRDTVYVDFKAKASEEEPFFRQMEELLVPFDCRKHWGTGIGDDSDPEYIINQFPNLREFIKLMNDFDQEGKFRNEQIRQWFQKINDYLGKNAPGEENF